MTQMYASFEEPKALEGRLENNLPFIYIGDKIKGTDIYNLSKKTGLVNRLYQEDFSRDDRGMMHFGVEQWFNKQFETLLLTLELKARNAKNKNILREGNLPIYLGDRVEVIDEYSPRRGRTGVVKEIKLDNGRVIYSVTDETFLYEPEFEEHARLLAEKNELIRSKSEEVLDEDEFEDNLDEDLEMGIIDEDLYEKLMSIRSDIIARSVLEYNPEYVDLVHRIKLLSNDMIFEIPDHGVDLVEQFPPNRVFNLELTRPNF